MKKLKVPALFLTAAMLFLTFVASASAIKDTDDQVASDPTDVILIDGVRQSGGSGYTRSFTTVPEYGKNMEVWVKNNSASSVYLEISRNGVELLSDYELGPGKQQTVSYQELAADGLSGDWKIYTYNRTGAKYDLSVNARQF
ncbi:hypothetical protein [Paenibacillus sp. TH7-28]